MDSLNKISSSGWQQFKAIGSGNKTTTQKKARKCSNMKQGNWVITWQQQI